MAQAVTNIAQVRSISAPALQYLWEFLIPRIPEAVPDAPREFSFRARTSALPGRLVNTAFSFFQGHRIKRPTRSDFTTTLAATYEEGLNGIISQTLNDWFNIWRDEREGSGQGEASFKTDAFMRMLDHENEVVVQYHLYDFFVENVADVPLSYSETGLVMRSVTFGYSYWVLE